MQASVAVVMSDFCQNAKEIRRTGSRIRRISRELFGLADVLGGAWRGGGELCGSVRTGEWRDSIIVVHGYFFAVGVQ
jgi:hypothetical protein